MEEKKEKVTLKERWNAFNEKHPKVKGLAVKIGLGIIAAAGGGAIGYTVGRTHADKLAEIAETAVDTAGELVEDVAETVSDAV